MINFMWFLIGLVVGITFLIVIACLSIDDNSDDEWQAYIDKICEDTMKEVEDNEPKM